MNRFRKPISFIILSIVVTFIINLVMVLSSAKGWEVTQAQGSRGNSVGNIVNGGRVLKLGGKVHILNSYEYLSNADHAIESEIDGNYLNGVGDWLFYNEANQGNWGIGGLQRLGSEKSNYARDRISTDRSTYVNIVGGRIYYINNSDKDKIYSTDLDGTRIRLLTKDAAQFLNVVDGWIYYVNKSDGNKIYKTTIDGKNKLKLNEEESAYINVVDGWIYYTNGKDENKVYKMKTDGSGKIKLNDQKSSYLNVEKDIVYYSDNTGIFKMKTDGTENMRLSSDANIEYINIVDDWIYFWVPVYDYTGAKMGTNVTKMKVDGTEKRSLVK